MIFIIIFDVKFRICWFLFIVLWKLVACILATSVLTEFSDSVTLCLFLLSLSLQEIEINALVDVTIDFMRIMGLKKIITVLIVSKVINESILITIVLVTVALTVAAWAEVSADDWAAEDWNVGDFITDFFIKKKFTFLVVFLNGILSLLIVLNLGDDFVCVAGEITDVGLNSSKICSTALWIKMMRFFIFSVLLFFFHTCYSSINLPLSPHKR